MFRFKLGVGVGLALGWLVASGKAAELIGRFRAGRSSPSASGAPVSSGPHLVADDQRHAG